MTTAADIIALVNREYATGMVRLSPGPIEIEVGQRDVLAMRLLATLPEDLTIGDLIGSLQAAIWWVTFFASMRKEEPDAVQETPT